MEAAWREGRGWVIVEDVRRVTDGVEHFRRVRMHIPTGVAVASETVEDDSGRLAYMTETYFLNRHTGEALPEGSRRWNRGVYATEEKLDRAVRAACDDVPRRFAGLIRVFERRRAAGRG